MKIKTIEYRNFRNFKDYGCIKCSTDGRITIIYGKNGDGKTTLHQLIQWILYNDVHFNLTTDKKKLYNMEFEKECPYQQEFEVYGSIEFEHNTCEYSLARTHIFRREIETKKISETVTLLKKDGDDNWITLSNPDEVINDLLPTGLSDYFFFDGENMIADLKRKGKESAKNLRTALYSIFDLDILECAVKDIGSEQLRTTVIGKLYSKKTELDSTPDDVKELGQKFKQTQEKFEELREQKKERENEQKELNDIIKNISESIGENKSKEAYEKERADLKKDRDNYLEMVEDQKKEFGNKTIQIFPRLLLSPIIDKAKKNIKSKIDENDTNLIAGVTRQLIVSLMDSSKCLCGNPITDFERTKLQNWLDLLPPNSYQQAYSSFCLSENKFNSTYSSKNLEIHIKNVLEYKDRANEKDQMISELDADEKNSQNIEELITNRKDAEEKLNECKAAYDKIHSSEVKYSALLNKYKKDLDAATKKLAGNEAIDRKIEIMKNVSQYFKDKLDSTSKEYSEKLEIAIQDLVNKMLTSVRKVNVSQDFLLKVYDSYNDESKSEGQFAVVSFAYIGGILNVLKDIDRLKNKEYPLVLDGPFSKLDIDQRQNVINTIPEYAPQVILFSKDNLQEYIPKEKTGFVWTIKSNNEQNVATVEEGFLW